MNRTPWARLLAILALLITVPLGSGQAQEDEAIVYAGLENYGINALAQLGDGRIAVGTHKGVFVADLTGVSPLPTAGLPGDGCADITEAGLPHCFVSDLAASGDALFAVVGPNALEEGTNGLYRLDGAKWTSVGAATFLSTDGGYGVRVSGVAVAPDGTLFVSVQGQIGYRPMDLAVIFRSTDGGSTWANVFSMEGIHVIEWLAVAPTGTIWASAGIPGADHWMLVSTTGGESWDVTAVARADDQPLGSHQARGISFDDDGTAYIVTSGGSAEKPIGVYRSKNDGATWRRLTDENPPQEQYAIAASADGSTLVHGAWGGLFRSDDAGKTWSEFASVGSSMIVAMLIDADGTLWVGANGNGLAGMTYPGLFRSATAGAAGLPAPTATTSTDGDVIGTSVDGDGGTTTGGADQDAANAERDDFRQRCLNAGGRFYEDPDGGYGCLPAGTGDEPCEVTEPEQTGETPEEEVIMEHRSPAAVQNGPPGNPTIFVIDEPHMITRIRTYHWNDAQGKTPGTIQLIAEDGTVYGPWQAVGYPGQGGVPDAYWEVTPNVVIPPGAYLVVDSDPATWSNNSDTNYEGVTWVYGYNV